MRVRMPALHCTALQPSVYTDTAHARRPVLAPMVLRPLVWAWRVDCCPVLVAVVSKQGGGWDEPASPPGERLGSRRNSAPVRSLDQQVASLRPRPDWRGRRGEEQQQAQKQSGAGGRYAASYASGQGRYAQGLAVYMASEAVA